MEGNVPKNYYFKAKKLWAFFSFLFIMSQFYGFIKNEFKEEKWSILEAK